MPLDWKDIVQDVGKLAPSLGMALGGPAGSLVGTLIAKGLGSDATPEAVQTALSITPDAQVKLAQIASEQKIALAQLAEAQDVAQVNADSSVVVEVNKTMQSEDQSGRGGGWRSLCGYSLAVTSFVMSMGVLFLAYLAITGKDPSALNAIPTIVSSVAMILAIPGAAVGINAYHSGLADRGK